MQLFVTLQTRILVTNSISILHQADLILVLEDGHVTVHGTCAELLSHNGAFAEYIATYLKADGGVDDQGTLINTHNASNQTRTVFRWNAQYLRKTYLLLLTKSVIIIYVPFIKSHGINNTIGTELDFHYSHWITGILCFFYWNIS